jgi:lysozyme family protein
MAGTNFEAALAHVLVHEGGYVDHPLDPGGATKYGITLATLVAWRGRPVAKAEVMALDRREAADIYRARFWSAVRADELPPGLDYAVFDLAVNSGPARAARLLSRALDLPEEPRLSIEMVRAAGNRPVVDLIRRLSDERRTFLRRLAHWPTFGRGWSRRVAEVERQALALAGAAGSSASQPATKDTPMIDTKSVLGSRTVWSNAVGLAALALSAFGFDSGLVESAKVTDALLQIVAGGSFVASTIFRVFATRRLTA